MAGMRSVEFFVPGLPRPKGNMRIVPGRRTLRDAGGSKLRAWLKLVRVRASQSWSGEPSNCPIGIRIVFHLPRPQTGPNKDKLLHDCRPDLDKLLRAVLDALTGITYRDDSQVCGLDARKVYTTDRPCVKVSLCEIVQVVEDS